MIRVADLAGGKSAGIINYRQNPVDLFLVNREKVSVAERLQSQVVAVRRRLRHLRAVRVELGVAHVRPVHVPPAAAQLGDGAQPVQ